jgi:hypothetical protein
MSPRWQNNNPQSQRRETARRRFVEDDGLSSAEGGVIAQRFVELEDVSIF